MISGFVVSVGGTGLGVRFLVTGVVVLGFFWILFRMVTVGAAVVVVRVVVLVMVERWMSS